MSRHLRIPAFKSVWERCEDGVIRPAGVAEGREHFLTAPASLDLEVRGAIEAWSAGLWGARRPEVELPEDIASYVSRVTAYAWGIDDAAVEDLREAGYDDPEIYEITLSAAIGVACAGAEALYAAMFSRS